MQLDIKTIKDAVVHNGPSTFSLPIKSAAELNDIVQQIDADINFSSGLVI